MADEHEPPQHQLFFKTSVVDIQEVRATGVLAPPDKMVILEWGCTRCRESVQMRVHSHHVHTVIRALQNAMATNPEAFTELVPSDQAPGPTVVTFPFNSKVN